VSGVGGAIATAGPRRAGRRGAATDARPHGGSRRLGLWEQWFWYLVAGLSYIAVGVYHKWLLNWFVGPAWLIAVLVTGPWLMDRARAKFGRRRDG
jgi:hypothetical protein